MNPECPTWPGAAGAYARAHRILVSMARSGHVVLARGKCLVSSEMRAFIDALDQGDEEAVKANNLTWAQHDRMHVAQRKEGG